jgi:FixJ family two-component response regulator
MQGEKVLIVDDEEDVLKSTEMLVDLLGYEAIPLMDPGRVIEVAEREHPGMILQDLKMKDLNLAGLVASLRSNPITAEIPLVFFSANADLANIAAKYDAWGYLAKPFAEKELAQVLDQTMHHGDPKGQTTQEAVRRDLRAAFHDYWNLLAALSTYVNVLERSETVSVKDRAVIAGLGDLLLKVESKTDRLRSYLTRLVG